LRVAAIAARRICDRVSRRTWIRGDLAILCPALKCKSSVGASSFVSVVNSLFREDSTGPCRNTICGLHWRHSVMGKRPTDSSPVPDRVAGAILLLRLRSQFVTSNGRGGRRYAPYAFTEQGVAMLSSVLRSRRAVLVNIEIMRARRLLASNAALARKLERDRPVQDSAICLNRSDCRRSVVSSATKCGSPRRASRFGSLAK